LGLDQNDENQSKNSQNDKIEAKNDKMRQKSSLKNREILKVIYTSF
jgi:hypothetical protein